MKSYQKISSKMNFTSSINTLYHSTTFFSVHLWSLLSSPREINQNDHRQRHVWRTSGNGAAIRSYDACLRFGTVVGNIHTGPMFRYKPVRCGFCGSSSVFPFHFLQWSLCHGLPIPRRRFTSESRHPLRTLSLAGPSLIIISICIYHSIIVNFQAPSLVSFLCVKCW